MKTRFRPLVLGAIFLLGCASGNVQGESADAGAPDGSSWNYYPHPCQETEVDHDFWNCGTSCDDAVVCSLANTDICYEGTCHCGEEPPCADGSDCRFSRCVASNPEGEGCEFDDECVAGYACIEGHCTFVKCVPEECDGVDNDCDDEVDESAPGSPLAELCFDGRYGEDVGDVLLPCIPGVRACVAGGWTECFGENPPVPEQGMLGCDGLDNNCDGCVDGVLAGGICDSAEPVGFDIMYVIDTSGSMSGTIAAVKTATHDFSESFSDNPEFRFGIVMIAAIESPNRPLLYLDLTDFDTFEDELALMDAFGGGSEPQWDAVYELGTGELPVTWREGTTRIIIVFSDENGQTYREAAGLSAVYEAEMCGALTSGEVLAVVELPAHFEDFDECAVTYELSNDAVLMVNNLDDIIADPCR